MPWLLSVPQRYSKVFLGWACSSVVDRLPNTCKTPGLISTIIKKNPNQRNTNWILSPLLDHHNRSPNRKTLPALWTNWMPQNSSVLLLVSVIRAAGRTSSWPPWAQTKVRLHTQSKKTPGEKKRESGVGGSVSMLVPGLHFILLTLCWQTTTNPI